MTRTRATFLTSLLVTLALLSACAGPAAEPTPTPTKTPAAAAAAEQPATPTPPPATATATALPAVVDPPAATPRPENIAPYTGLPAENTEWLGQRPILICVNNDAAGRSAHYGLSKADLVYEYIVDGFTLTRLTALYQSQNIDRVGPVRSARFPNVWMTYMYDGALACSGGSDEIRYILKNEVGFPYLDADIDDPSQTRYFFSLGDDYRTRMQSNPDGVRQYLADSGTQKAWDRPGFAFSETPPPNAAGEAASVTIPYPGGNTVEWRYDPGLGGYTRFQGGRQQFDLGANVPIVAQNVIVLGAAHELTDIVEDSLGTKGVDVQLYGFGDLRVFRDGQVYEGTWRADPETPPRLFGPGEVIIDLRPGQSWFQIVQDVAELNY